MPRLKLSILLALAAALFATSCVTNDRYAGYNTFEDPRLQRDLETTPNSLPESTFSWWDENGRAESNGNGNGNDKSKGKGKRNGRNMTAEKATPGHAPLRVIIDLSDQAATFYRGRTQVGRARVATGKYSHSTPTGEFSILEKTADKRSNLYGHIVDAEGTVVVSDADSRKDEIPEGGSFNGASMPYWMRLTPAGVGMHAGPIPRPGRPASHGCIRMPKEMARLLFENSRIGTPVTIVP